VGMPAFSHGNLAPKKDKDRRSCGELGEECDIARTAIAPIVPYHRPVSQSPSLPVSSLCLPPHTLHRGTVSSLGWLRWAQFLRSSPRPQMSSTPTIQRREWSIHELAPRIWRSSAPISRPTDMGSYGAHWPDAAVSSESISPKIRAFRWFIDPTASLCFM
jgi:hypothetical protein